MNNNTILTLLQKNCPSRRHFSIRLDDPDIILLLMEIAKKEGTTATAVFNSWVAEHKDTLIKRCKLDSQEN